MFTCLIAFINNLYKLIILGLFMKRLYLAPLLFTPTLAYAHFAISEGAFFGFLIGIIIGIVITVLLKVRVLAKVLLFLPITFTTMFASTIVGDKISAFNRKYEEKASAQQFHSNPLRAAICNENIGEIQTILNKPLDSFTTNNIGKFLQYCPDNKEVNLLVMKYLHSQPKPTNIDIIDYCDLLRGYHENFNKETLKFLVDAKLPIVCDDVNGSVYFHLSMNQYMTKQEEQRIYDWLIFLIENKVFNEKKNLYINDLVETGSARIILLALEVGDFYKKSSSSGTIPIEIWTNRMFQYCEGCLLKMMTLNITPKEIDMINKAIRPINAEEINNSQLLLKLENFRYYPDTGAAFFNHLMKQGPKLDVANTNGISFLGQHTKLSSELIAELKKLSKEQVNEMAFPKKMNYTTNSLEPGIPLLDSAKQQTNKELIEFLCSHNIKGC